MRVLDERLGVMGRRAFFVVLILGVLLVASEFVFGREGKVDVENIVLFPALFGGIVSLVMIGLSHIVKALLGRERDYYDNE